MGLNIKGKPLPLLYLYIGLLILVLIIQAAILVLLYTGKDMIFNLWTVRLGELISSYGDKNLPGKKHQWDILNNLQRTLHCCGQNNFTDWKGNKHKEHADQVPCSCTTSTTNKWFCDVVENATYIKGCEEDTRMWYEANTWLLISINAGLLLVEVLQFVAAAWLFRLMKKTKILPMS
ncbi:putative tetraspanin-19 [Varanus komodoensis]|nr:putative tetraspanin-19 [Varanus komodoensis]